MYRDRKKMEVEILVVLNIRFGGPWAQKSTTTCRSMCTDVYSAGKKATRSISFKFATSIINNTRIDLR